MSDKRLELKSDNTYRYMYTQPVINRWKLTSAGISLDNVRYVGQCKKEKKKIKYIVKRRM